MEVSVKLSLQPGNKENTTAHRELNHEISIKESRQDMQSHL